MFVFEIKHQGRRLWLPQITPANADAYPFAFPETSKTGLLYAFDSIEGAKNFFRSQGVRESIEGTFMIDLDSIKEWSEDSTSNVDLDQVNALYMLIIDYYTEISKAPGRDFNVLRELNEKIVLQARDELLERARGKVSKAVSAEDAESLSTFLQRQDVKCEVADMVAHFEQILSVNAV